MTFTLSAVAPPRGRLRGWFRGRLDREPRRWVLFLVAAQGLVGWAGFVARRPAADASFAALAELAGAVVVALAPFAAVIWLYVHGRLLWWSGRALGGQGTPAELRAGLAWSSLPLLAVGWPHVLHEALRVAQLDRDVVPGWLLFSSDLARALSELAGHLDLIAGLCAGVLYVTFVAEAQRFGKRRAIANHLLAALLLFALMAGGVGLGYALRDSSAAVPALACAAAGLVAWRVWLGRRRGAPVLRR